MRGRKHLGVYHAVLREPGRRATRSPAGRRFCVKCGSPLWLWDPRWPELIHPHASAIDSELPKPPEVVEIGLAWAPSWVDAPGGPGHVQFAHMPDESLEGLAPGSGAVERMTRIQRAHADKASARGRAAGRASR